MDLSFAGIAADTPVSHPGKLNNPALTLGADMIYSNTDFVHSGGLNTLFQDGAVQYIPIKVSLSAFYSDIGSGWAKYDFYKTKIKRNGILNQ